MQTNAAHRWVLAVVCLLPACGVGVVGFVFAQTETAPSAVADSKPNAGRVLEAENVPCPSDATLQKHEYSGWQNCHFCHRGGNDGKLDDNEELNILVAMNESTTWQEHDKHALAAKVLVPDQDEQNLAYHMQQALGVSRYSELVKNDCQACHVAGEPEPQNIDEPSSADPKLNHQFGVTCEACHGPAKDWVHDHWEQRKTWRYKSPAEKAEVGFVNLRDPVTKARKCLSCHLGDVKEGKTITHEMYAAGHPPLAGFDVATFSSAMPRHWTPLSARTDKKYDKFKEVHRAGRIGAPNTREVLLGGLAALESNLKLLSDYAALPGTSHGWPEFALYDCFACHHDLQAQSLRLRSRGRSQAGRPPLRMWPNVVAELALRQTETPPQLATVLADVSEALAEQPFAERDRLGAAAGAAARLVCQEIKRLEDQLDRTKLASDDDATNRERQLVVQVLNQICELGSSEQYDYDSARQLVWAFERVYEDYKKLSPNATEHAAVDRALGELKAPNLKFDLVQGQQQVGESGTLAAFLEARSNYDPQTFIERFGRLRDLMQSALRTAQRGE